MSIKNVVKVMNFHSLLRVDKARKKAEKLFQYEKELTNVITSILCNRNLILDKKIMIPSNKNNKLDIYIGNDFGFCANFNQLINELVINDKENDKVLIGKKIIDREGNILLFLTKEDFLKNYQQVDKIISDSVLGLKHSEINIIYNHYYNINKLELVTKKVFPREFEGEKNIEDFVVEGNLDDILINLIALYISYEIRVAETNSYAAENIMRQQVTSESLKKIDEMEEQKTKEDRKVKKYKNFKKIIDNFRKMDDTEE